MQNQSAGQTGRSQGKATKETQNGPSMRKPLDPRRVLQILECKRKVMNFVELMLEDTITMEALKSGESLISKLDYDSIVQERYILKICGYPLCSNKLIKEWKQRYHISMRDKRIYNVEIRKLFCSVKCMDSSTNYRNEFIPDQPLWMRLDNLKLGPDDIELEQDQDEQDIFEDCTG